MTLPLDEAPEWAVDGFDSPAEHAEWARWRRAAAAGQADPDAWVHFPGEGRWYRNRDLLHVRQLTNLATQLQPQTEHAGQVAASAEPAADDAALDEVLASVGYERA